MIDEDSSARGDRTWVRRLVSGVATLVCVALVVVGIRLVDVVVSDWVGTSSYHGGNMVDASRWFARNKVLNPVQPWLSDYNAGTAAFGREHWAEAEQDYRSALRTVPEQHRCRVVLNLAWSIEARADALKANDDVKEARAAWAEASKVVNDYSCRRPPRSSGKRGSSGGGSGGSSARGRRNGTQGSTGSEGDDIKAGALDQPTGNEADQQSATRGRIQRKEARTENMGDGMNRPQQSGGGSTTDAQRAEQLRQMQQDAAARSTTERDRQQRATQRSSHAGTRRNPADRPW